MGAMMQNPFGGGDPFANDPFFSEPFGQMGSMDKMIGKMRNDMKRSMNEPMSMKMNGMGSGKFSQMQSISSTKTDQYGRPVKQTYQTKANGAIGNGNKVTERHQMYENSGTGHQKMAHERMMNDQGRKIVRQRVGGAGGHSESNDVFKNVSRQNAGAFD